MDTLKRTYCTLHIIQCNLIIFLKSFTKYFFSRIFPTLKFSFHFHSLPWDQKTFIGWIGLNIYCFVAALSYYLINNALLAFFLCICYQHQTFSECFKMLIIELDADASFKSEYRKLNLQLIQLIKCHNLTME